MKVNLHIKFLCLTNETFCLYLPQMIAIVAKGKKLPHKRKIKFLFSKINKRMSLFQLIEI